MSGWHRVGCCPTACGPAVVYVAAACVRGLAQLLCRRPPAVVQCCAPAAPGQAVNAQLCYHGLWAAMRTACNGMIDKDVRHLENAHVVEFQRPLLQMWPAGLSRAVNKAVRRQGRPANSMASCRQQWLSAHQVSKKHWTRACTRLLMSARPNMSVDYAMPHNQQC